LLAIVVQNNAAVCLGGLPAQLLLLVGGQLEAGVDVQVTFIACGNADGPAGCVGLESFAQVPLADQVAIVRPPVTAVAAGDDQRLVALLGLFEQPGARGVQHVTVAKAGRLVGNTHADDVRLGGDAGVTALGGAAVARGDAGAAGAVAIL